MPSHNRTHENHAVSQHAEYKSYEVRAASPPDDPVAELLRQVQAHVHDLAHAKVDLEGTIRDVEGQLAKANAEIGSLRSELDHLARLKGLYERKFASIRDLAQQ